MKKILALLLAVVMIFALAACSGSSGGSSESAATEGATANDAAPAADAAVDDAADDAPETAPDAAPGADAPEAAAGDAFIIGGHSLGTGAYNFEKFRHMQEAVVAACGDEYIFADNEYTPDNMIPDAQTLLASGAQGMVVQKIFDAIAGTIGENCAARGVYFVCTEYNPVNDMETYFYGNEYFAGAMGLNNQDAGEQLAQLAYDNGMRTAMIVCENAGSANSDAREAAFTEAFEALGGTVVGTVNCTDTSEAVTKSEDLYLTNPDVDMCIAVGGECLLGACSLVDKYGDAAPALYGVTIDDTIADYIRDGHVVACYDDQQTYATFAAIMLEHVMHTGEIFTGDDGRALCLSAPGVIVTAENIDLFQKVFADNCSFTDEEIIDIVNNYDSAQFIEAVNGVSLESRAIAQYEAGSVTADELAAAGISVD